MVALERLIKEQNSILEANLGSKISTLQGQVDSPTQDLETGQTDLSTLQVDLGTQTGMTTTLQADLGRQTSKSAPCRQASAASLKAWPSAGREP